MEVFVYNENVEPLGLIDVYNTIIFEKNYTDLSKINLLLPYSTLNAYLLKPYNIITKHNISYTDAYEIRFIRYKKNVQGYAEIEAECEDISTWLKRRVTVNGGYFKGLARTKIHQLFTENFSYARNINNYLLYIEDGLNAEIESEFRQGVNLYDEIKNICDICGYGFRSSVNINTKQFILVIYNGKSRIAGTDENCVFNDSYGDILNSEYTFDIGQKRTIALGNLSTGELISQGSNELGAFRHELYVTSEKNSEGNELELLNAKLKDELSKYEAEELFKCDINPNGNLKYRTHFDVGDTVTCVSEQWNIQKNYRIINIKEAYTRGNYKIEVGFGIKSKSVIDKIKLLRG